LTSAILDRLAASDDSQAAIAVADEHVPGGRIDPDIVGIVSKIAHQIAVVDLRSGKQVSTWRVPGLGANFPMALAGPTEPLAVVFRSSATLAIFDPTTGALAQRLQTCGDADDIFFDGKRDRIYVSCGDGSINVMERSGQGFGPEGRVPTSAGARTSLFVPESDRLFVAARAGVLGSPAAILVFRPAS
jgi:hypothetical protein